MKQSQARKYLEDYKFLIMKYRSNAKEELDPDSYRLAETDLAKWILNDKYCPLAKIVEFLDSEKDIEPLFFYNCMTILHKFSYSLIAMSAFWNIPDFPEPDIKWLKGWEKE